ncbi:MAG: fibronectin type III domain-containing protein [SAR324 cluster bacterium]|nr:fibronectin type III domain-containing protein [SAR324 cluster bacterium]
MKHWNFWALLVALSMTVSCAPSDSDNTVDQIPQEDRISIENLKVETTDKDQVLLTWDQLEGAKKYKILRKFESDSSFLIQDTVDINSYSSFVFEENYVFRIWALNSLGQIFAESEDFHLDTRGPDTPANFRAQATGFSTIRLSWDSVTGSLGYKIYRNDGAGYFTLIRQFKGAAVNTWTDFNLFRGYRYQYKITSYIEFEHESAESGVLEVYTFSGTTCSTCTHDVITNCVLATCTVKN